MVATRSKIMLEEMAERKKLEISAEDERVLPNIKFWRLLRRGLQPRMYILLSRRRGRDTAKALFGFVGTSLHYRGDVGRKDDRGTAFEDGLD